MSAAQLSSGSIKPRPVSQAGEIAAYLVAIIRHISARLPVAQALLLLLPVLPRTMASAQTAHLSSVQSILSLPSALNYPQEMAIDGSGNIYIADAYNKRVLKLTPSASGGFTQSTIGTGWNVPYGLAVDAGGNVYVADIFFTTLIKETPNGSGGYTQSTIGSNLYDAVSVAVDKQGNVYGVEINNSFIGTMFKETLSGGTYTQSFIPVPGTHGVSNVEVDGKGNLFVNDGWDGGQIYELSPVGDNLYTTTEFLSSGGAITIDGNNNIYLAPYQGNIYELSPNGSGYTTTNTIPTNPNAIATPYGYFGPTGIVVDANGNVYFTDIYTNSLIEESLTSGNFGSLDVGYSSYPVSLFFTFDSFGYMQSTSVSTQGSASPLLDFSDAGTGDCYPASYGVGYTCEIDVTFTPSAAGVRTGAAELIDSNGNTIATGYVQGTGVAPLVNFSPGTTISEHIASNGSAVAVDALANLYTAAPGRSTAFIDSPAGGSSWSEVPVGSGLGSATGIAIDGGGDLYIADQTDKQIVKETLSTNGYSQSVIADSANGLHEPTGVAVDASGNVFVTDVGTNSVLKESLQAGAYTQSVLPTSALNQPTGVAVDAAGNVYIADTDNDRVLKETVAGSSYVETTIGTGLSSPTAVAVDGFGNVYISETNAGVVLKETLTAGSYVQSTMASGITPYGLAVDSNLNLYIAGSSSQLLAKVDVADAPALTFASTAVGTVSADSPKTVTVENNGNAALTFPVPSNGNNPSISANFTLNSIGATACPLIESTSPSPGNLAAGTSCTLSISFSPAAAGSISGAVVLTDNNLGAANSTQSISLSASAYSVVATTTGLGSSSNPSSYGQSVTITATVTQASGTNVPTGTVQFSIDGNAAGSPVALNGGVATYNTGTLTTGGHSIGAVYTPTVGSAFTASSATALSQVVNKAAPVITWATPSAITYGTPLSATQLDASSTVQGSFNYTPASSAVLTAGSQTLSVTFTPTDVTDYTAPTKTVQLTVNKAPLSVTVNNQSMNYGATVPTLTGTLTGVLGSDGITASYATTGTSSSPVGPYPITATLNDPNSKLGNYSVSNTPGTLTIGKATPAITWAAPSAITYGTPLSATQLDANSTVQGSFNYTPALGTVLAAGPQTLSVTFIPTVATDYTAATQTVQMTVNKATPTITWATPAAIVSGTALSATQLNATASVPGTFAYAPAAGTIPAAGSDTLSVTFTATDATDYSASTATVTLTVNNPVPVVSGITPLFVSMGSPAFTLTVNGSGFMPSSTVYWGATALTTQYVSAVQLTAQVPASEVATAGIANITVQTPAPGGGISNNIQFEIDSTTSGSTTPPIFTTVSDTVTPGTSATYPVTLPSSATNISVTCLNLPSGASCTFTPATGAVTITTSSTTPAGTFKITLVFTETLPGATPALVLLPILLLPLISARRRWTAGRTGQMICLGIVFLAVAASMGCAGGSQANTGGSQTETVTSSGVVSLTVQ